MVSTIAEVEVGEIYEGYVIIKGINVGTTKNGDPFLNVLVGDVSLDIEFKVWSEQVGLFTEAYGVDDVVKLRGQITLFRDKKQLQVQEIRKVKDDEEVDMSTIIRVAEVAGSDAIKEIRKVIDADIENPVLKEITEVILEENEELFIEYPAAQLIHHNYVGGLAYHTLSMLTVARSLTKVYPFLDKELLYAGLILHDVGKVKEYAGITDTQKTLDGHLLGHISIISQEIYLVAERLGYSEHEEVVLLQHMVLSHHGKLEWGSPVKPLLPEAEILHHIDMIDARMDGLKKAYEGVEKGSFTEKLFAFDGRSFYKSNK